MSLLTYADARPHARNMAAKVTAGTMPPLMAAWAPNAIFGAGAAYLLLSVRT